MQLLTLSLRTIDPITNKYPLLIILSVFLPLTLNIKNPAPAISGFIGGATAATLVNKSSSSSKQNNEIELPTLVEKPLDSLSVKPETIVSKPSNPNEREFPLEIATQEVEVIEVEEDLLQTPPDSQLPETKKVSNTLISLLDEKGIETIKHYEPQESDRALDPIACYLRKHYSILKNLHRKIKASIANKTDFSFKLDNNTQQETQICTQFCSDLYRASLLSEYYYDKRRKNIYGTVQHRGDIIQFLTGGWFERAVLSQVKKKLALCDNVEFLVNPHVKFANGDRFELDLLFLLDNQLFWIECKTGNHYNNCLSRYCEHRKKLGVSKEKAFLVGLELPDRDAENWTSLWSITVVNPDGLEEKLTEFKAAMS